MIKLGETPRKLEEKKTAAPPLRARTRLRESVRKTRELRPQKLTREIRDAPLWKTEETQTQRNPEGKKTAAAASPAVVRNQQSRKASLRAEGAPKERSPEPIKKKIRVLVRQCAPVPALGLPQGRNSRYTSMRFLFY